MKAYKVRYGQNLMDVALHVYGDYTGVFLLLEDNPALEAIETSLTAGQTLVIREEIPVLSDRNIDYATFYTRNGIVVNSGRKVAPVAGSGYYEDGYIEEGYFERT